jgi:hypothetical protein
MVTGGQGRVYGLMSVLIGRYEFEGPLINWRGVKQQSGIYAIMSYAKQEFEIVELAEAEDLQSVLLDEEKQRFWQARSLGMLTFSVHYSRATRGRRREIVGEILREFDGDCRDFRPADGLVLSSSCH